MSLSQRRIESCRSPVASRFWLWVVLALMAFYAAAGLLASLVPPSAMATGLKGLSGSGGGAAQFETAYATLVTRARTTSAVLGAVWLVLVWHRRWLAAMLARAGTAARLAAFEWPARFRVAVRHATTVHRTETLLFAAILLGGTALRLAYLGRDLRHDEAWTYMVYARRPLYLSPLLLTDVNHHPLNTILIQVFTAVFGNSVPVIRLPAFLFGVGCIPAAFVLARVLGGPGAALLAAALVAGSTPLVEYSVNARGYAGVAFFTLVLLRAGWNAIERGGSAGVSGWPLAVLAAVLGAYANIVMLLPCIASFTWFGLLCLARPAPERARELRRAVCAGVAAVAGVVLLYLPFLTVSGWAAISGSQGIKARAGVAAAFATVPAFFGRLAGNWDRDVGPVAAAAVLALAAAAGLLARRRRRDCGLLWLGVGAAVLFQLGAVRDPGPERIWLPFLAPLLVLAAVGLDGVLVRLRAGPAWPGAVAVLALAALATAAVRSGTLLTSTETAYFPAARAVAADVLALEANDTLAISAVRADEVLYYARREGLVLQPVRSEGALRYFQRPRAEQGTPGQVVPAQAIPAQAVPGRVVMVFDKLLGQCTVEDCTRQAVSAFPVAAPPILVRDTPDYAELVATRAPSR